MKQYVVNPIGTIRNRGEEVFLELEPAYAPALTALKGFSHIQVIWWFNGFDDAEARKVLEVPQPYKKAPAVMGIFATRSPVRPNPIALTAVQILSIDPEKSRIELAYIDANDGSPVLDIKPYTPSLDRVENPQVPEWCRHWPISLEQSGSFPWEEEFNF